MIKKFIEAARDFSAEISQIAYDIIPFLISKKKIPDIAKAIDTAERTNPNLKFFIETAIENNVPKTPAYYAHTEIAKKSAAARKKYNIPNSLPESMRMRKDRFLAYYDLLKLRKEKEEKEETIIRCYRDVLQKPTTGTTAVGVNLYFVSTEMHLDDIVAYMERIHEVFHNAIQYWQRSFEYTEGDISECDWDDVGVSPFLKGFVFEISDDSAKGWHYSGVWKNEKWDTIDVPKDFPLVAVEMLLKQAGL